MFRLAWGRGEYVYRYIHTYIHTYIHIDNESRRQIVQCDKHTGTLGCKEERRRTCRIPYSNEKKGIGNAVEILISNYGNMDLHNWHRS